MANVGSWAEIMPTHRKAERKADYVARTMAWGTRFERASAQERNSDAQHMHNVGIRSPWFSAPHTENSFASSESCARNRYRSGSSLNPCSRRWRLGHRRRSQAQLVVLFFFTSMVIAAGGTWQVATLSGNGESSFVDGVASTASFREPRGIAVSSGSSAAFVCDSANGKIRRVNLRTGGVTTLQGSFGIPTGIAILDEQDHAVFTDHTTHNIYFYNLTSQTASVLAGNGNPGYADGAGQFALFSRPSGIAKSSTTSMLIADTDNHIIRELNISSGQVFTMAGNGVPGYADGQTPIAQFSSPVGLAVDSDRGLAVIADSGNFRVRLLNMSTGYTSTLAGSGIPGILDGPPGQASFSELKGVAFIDGGQRVVVADGSRIRSITVDAGYVTTLAGSSSSAYRDGSGTTASFRGVYGLAPVLNGTAFVAADMEDHRLRVVRNCSGAECPDGQSRPCATNYSLGGNDECQCPDVPDNAVLLSSNCSWICSSGFYWDTGAATCVACAAYPSGGCPAGQYWEACDSSTRATCASCPAGLTSRLGSNGSASCSCPPGLTGSECTSCPQGTYKSEIGRGPCTLCPSNSTSDVNSTDISACKCSAGLYGASSGSCSPCPIGTYKNESDTQCNECPSNTTTLSVGSQGRANCVCQENFFGFAFLKETMVRNVSRCYDMAADNTTNATTVCETMESTLFKFANLTFRECRPCPALSVSPTGSLRQSDCTCQQGFLGSPGSACRACPDNADTRSGVNVNPEDCLCNPGFYDQNVTAGESSVGFVCLPCPLGTVKTAAGRGACVGCSALDPLSNSTGTGGDDCKCLAGTEPVAEVCTLCQPGYFKNVSGDVNCTACPTGTYQPSSGARQCLPCPANTYNNLEGNSRSQCYACRPCPPNSESPARTGLRSQCQCSAGYTGRPGETCRPCPAGTYKSVLGDSECLACSSVGDNLWSAPGAAACSCDVGFAGPLEGPCTACPAGTAKGTVGLENCTDCAAGSYAPRDSAATQCVTCVNGSFSEALSVNASSCSCNRGYTGTPPDACVACDPGYFKATAGDDDCQPCPVDTYQTESASVSCEDCPSRTSSPVNSSSLQDCLCAPRFQPTTVYDSSSGSPVAVGDNCTECPANTYKDWYGNDACDSCQTFSSSGSGSFRCTCIDGYTESLFDPDVCKLCTPYPANGCPQNKYWKTCDELDSGCVSCPDNSGSPNASLSILDCSCNPGYEGDRTRCRACEAGKFKMTNGSNSCERCEEGFYQAGEAGTTCSICTALQTCPEGQFWNTCPGNEDGHCELCTGEPANAHFSGPGNPLWVDNCPSECDEGYENLNGVCTACEAGKYRSVFETSCQDCTAPATNTAGASGYCTKCIQGYYFVAWDYFGHAICARCASRHTTTLEAAAGFADNCRCDIGYFGFSWHCEPCPAGTFKPTISETPDLERYLGTYVAADNCTACGAGKFSNEDAQVSSDVCEECPESSDANDGSSQCSCNAGYYDTDDTYIATCLPCPANTYNELKGQDGVASCIQCPDPNAYASEASTLATDCQCNVGYSGDHLSCSICPNGTFAEVRGLSECRECKNGTVTLSATSTDPSACRCPTNSYGDYPDTGICFPCPNNSFTFGPDKRARGDCTCNEGYFGNLADLNASCAVCPENMYPWESLFFCSCNAGYYQNVSQVINTNFDSTTNLTTTRNRTIGNDMCLQCPLNASSENAAVGVRECFCNAGFYGNPGKQVDCVACPSFASSPPGSITLAACTCISGFFGDPVNNVTCEPCVSYDNNSFTWDNSINCTCNTGFYGSSNPELETLCAACPIGTYNDMTSQATASSCQSCPRRSKSQSGSSSIFDCACNGGYYREVTGDADMVCLVCPSGTFSNVSGLVDIAECASCPQFTVSRPASLVVEACMCEPGYYGPAGQACSPCPNNTFNTEVGLVNASSCLPCSSNSSSPPGSIVCSCDPGFYGDPAFGIKCLPCGANTFQPFTGMTSPADCVPCSFNFSTAPNASDTCFCISGFYGQPISGQPCSSCPSFATSAEGSVSIFQCGCSPGYYGNPARNVSCQACPELSITSTGATTIDECKCNVGFYGDPAANLSCSACPPNATSAVGAGVVADCFCVEGTYGKPECNVTCLPCPAASLSAPGTPTIGGCLCNAGFYGGSPSSAASDLDCAVVTTTPPLSTSTILPNATTNTSFTSTSALFSTPVRRRLMSANDTSVTEIENSTGSLFCFACPENSVSAPGSSNLSNCSCQVGFYGDPLLGVTCKACPSMSTSALGSKNLSDCLCMPAFFGNPSDNVTCLPCAGNSSSSLGSTVKSNCSCNAGYFGDAALFNRSGPSCQACPPNSYNPLADQIPPSACLSCPANSTSLAASTMVGQCDCVAGFYGRLDRETSCTACEVNTYNPRPAQRVSRACRRCPLNAITLSEASDDLLDCICDRGYYQYFIGSSMYCLPCPSGTYGAKLGQTHVNNCTRCPALTFSTMASRNLSDCTCNAGFVASDSGQCEACPADTYAPTQNSSSCLPCPLNSSSVANSSSCSCFAGSYRVGLSACQPCPTATYNPLAGQTNASACVACPTGSDSSTLGAASDEACLCAPGYFGQPAACTACGAGTYNPLSNQTLGSACIACAGNFTSAAASSACSPVNATAA